MIKACGIQETLTWCAEEVNMILMNFDVSRCDRPEKEVVEGVCLSLDMVREICLETMERCVALQKDEE